MAPAATRAPRPPRCPRSRSPRRARSCGGHLARPAPAAPATGATNGAGTDPDADTGADRDRAAAAAGHAPDRHRSVRDRHRASPSAEIQRSTGAKPRRRDVLEAGHHQLDLRARRQPPGHPRPGQLPCPHPGERHRHRRRLGHRRGPRRDDRSAGGRPDRGDPRTGDACAGARRRSAAWSTSTTTAFPPGSRRAASASERTAPRPPSTMVSKARCCSTPARAISPSMPTPSAGAPTITASPATPICFLPTRRRSSTARQPNSSLRTSGQSVGGSYLFDGGFVGVAVSHFASLYRIPGIEATETGTRIDRTRPRSPARASFARKPPPSTRSGSGSAPPTTSTTSLRSRTASTASSRPSPTSRRRAASRSSWRRSTCGSRRSPRRSGCRPSNVRLTAPGVEGGLFDPNRTTSVAGFIFNELKFTELAQDAGRRPHRAGQREGLGARSAGRPLWCIERDLKFTPKSGAVGFLHDLPWGMVASVTAQYVERAPRAPELLSQGRPRGDRDVRHRQPEPQDRGRQDPWRSASGARVGPFRFEATAYYTRFNDFIFRRLTGETCDGDFASCTPIGTGTELNQAVWSQRDAIFRGGEIAGAARRGAAVDRDVGRRRPIRHRAGDLHRRHATCRAFRRSASAAASTGATTTGSRASACCMPSRRTTSPRTRRRPPATTCSRPSSPTGQGLNPLHHGGISEIAFGIIGNNLLNDDIRNHVSFKKDEVLLPGRGVKFFFNAKFGGEATPDKALPITKAPVFRKAPIMAAWNWAGFYLGANIGYSAGGSHTDAAFTDNTIGPPPVLVVNSYSPLDGAIGGGQAGFNWQSGVFVAGVEADFQGARQRGWTTIRLSRRELQSGSGRRFAGDRDPGAEIAVVRNAAGASRHRRAPGRPGVRDRRRGRRGHRDQRHDLRFRRRRQRGRAPASAAAPPERAGRRAPASKAISAPIGPARSSTSIWISARSRPTRPMC